MPVFNILRESAIQRTPRVMQAEGLFDLVAGDKSSVSWQIDLPMALDEFEWNVGLIVGPSGSGKTTIARELFPDSLVNGFEWDESKSILDGFPESMGIKEITGLLTSVGFSSPPSWVKPYHVLSNGEQFRATMARAMAKISDLIVMDEFTSVVDRTVAKIGSAAIAKAIRNNGQQFIALSCHYDIAEWLEPDWIYEPHLNKFTRGCLQRPSINLEIHRCGREAWQLFKKHHYLSTDIQPVAFHFIGLIEGQPAAFVSASSFPHPKAPGYREHRVVCLPDFQGLGIGMRMADYIASLMVCRKPHYYSTLSHPAAIRHKARSESWQMTRKPSRTAKYSGTIEKADLWNKTLSDRRLTASFKYRGRGNPEDAHNFGII